jgi:hypothetical protein
MPVVVVVPVLVPRRMLGPQRLQPPERLACRSIPSRRAVPRERSMVRPRTYGPLSVTVTTSAFLVRGLMTRILVPNGKNRCAAVLPIWSNREPSAARRPWKYPP